MKKQVSLWAPQTSRFCSDAQTGFGTQRVCCFCPELKHAGQTFPVCSRHVAGHPGAGQPSRELQGAMDLMDVDLLRGTGMVEAKDSVQLQGKEREVRAVALGDSWTRTSPRRSGPRLGTHLLGKPRTGTVTTWQPCAIRGSVYCDPQWCQATAMCHCRADRHSLSHPQARAGPSPDLQLSAGCWGTTAGGLELDGL